MLPPRAAAAAAATAGTTTSTAAGVRIAAPSPRGSLHCPRQLLAVPQQPSRRRSASGLLAGVSGRTAGGALAARSSPPSPPLPSSLPSSPSPLALGARRHASTSTAAAAAASSSSGPNASSDPLSEAAKAVVSAAADAAAAADKPKKKKKWSGLARRAGSGVALGAGAAATIAFGGWVLCGVACLVVYQASQEYYGLVTSQGEPFFSSRNFSLSFTFFLSPFGFAVSRRGGERKNDLTFFFPLSLSFSSSPSQASSARA